MEDMSKDSLLENEGIVFSESFGSVGLYARPDKS